MQIHLQNQYPINIFDEQNADWRICMKIFWLFLLLPFIQYHFTILTCIMMYNYGIQWRFVLFWFWYSFFFLIFVCFFFFYFVCVYFFFFFLLLFAFSSFFSFFFFVILCFFYLFGDIIMFVFFFFFLTIIIYSIMMIWEFISLWT